MKCSWNKLNARGVSIAALFVLSLLAVAPAMAQSLEGVWRSEGYGDLYVIKNGEVKTFEVTSTTCMPGFTATQSAGATADREATFKAVGSRQFFIRSGGAKDKKVLHVEGAEGDRVIDRISRVPEVCDHPLADTPQNNFEVFTRTWAEQYISFDLHHADWEKIVAANRPKVTAETTPAELFDLFVGMIQPFGDAHTSINAQSIGKNFKGFKLGETRSPKSVLEVTDRLYLKGGLESSCQNQVQYGHIDETTGYLRVLSFGRFSAAGDHASGVAELHAALDKAFSDKRLKALVIDVRINGGGSDALGLAIASRLTDRGYLAYSKVARADPVDHNKWTPPVASAVTPGRQPRFLGAIVELTGPSTVSAGETFTQGLMGRTPHITRIGENTQGVFADVLGRKLPNGWRFGMPNEVFLTPQGSAFDGPGIPPDIQIPVFAPADLAAGKDPAMAKALEILASARAEIRNQPTAGQPVAGDQR
jgi:hypothetical protein